VREVARSLGVKPGQVAIAWLLHKGPDIVPIPGTKRVKYLEENVAAASVSLDAAQVSALDEALAPGKVSGPRYNATVMSMVDR
jgi:aryl-alcohol dehydrogenase-like predicted oxidoreductase